MLYCKIKDNTIEYGPKELPPVYENVSNFNYATPEQAAQYGFYVVSKPNIDTATEKYGDPVIDNITKTVLYPIFPKTEEELTKEFNDYKKQKDNEVKWCRQEFLDKIVRSAGVSAVYDKNVLYSQLFMNGNGSDIIGYKFDTTPLSVETYLTEMAAPIGMSATIFAQYVLSENNKGHELGRQVENGYVAYKTAVAMATLTTAMDESVAEYRQTLTAIFEQVDI